jgi:hypothetical protein
MQQDVSKNREDVCGKLEAFIHNPSYQQQIDVHARHTISWHLPGLALSSDGTSFSRRTAKSDFMHRKWSVLSRHTWRCFVREDCRLRSLHAGTDAVAWKNEMRQLLVLMEGDAEGCGD